MNDNICKTCAFAKNTDLGGIVKCTISNFDKDIEYWCSQYICDGEKIQKAAKPSDDPVSHPAHYTQGGIECIDAIRAALGRHFIGFLIGNAIKYLWRYQHKNGVEDLKKAQWYLDRAIRELE